MGAAARGTAGASPELLGVANNADQGIDFSARKEHYISCWFRSARPDICKEDIRIEVDGFGAAAYVAERRDSDWWVACAPLPRGLGPGWKPVRVRLADTQFSNVLRIAVDLPLQVSRIVCQGVHDSISWKSDEVSVAEIGYLSCWADGLPENADRANVRVWLDDRRLSVVWVGVPDAEGKIQVNITVPAGVTKGEHGLQIECCGIRSEPKMVRVV